MHPECTHDRTNDIKNEMINLLQGDLISSGYGETKTQTVQLIQTQKSSLILFTIREKARCRNLSSMAIAITVDTNAFSPLSLTVSQFPFHHFILLIVIWNVGWSSEFDLLFFDPAGGPSLQRSSVQAGRQKIRLKESWIVTSWSGDRFWTWASDKQTRTSSRRSVLFSSDLS